MKYRPKIQQKQIEAIQLKHYISLPVHNLPDATFERGDYLIINEDGTLKGMAKDVFEERYELASGVTIINDPGIINVPFIAHCPELCQHEYPLIWGGIYPPHCKKCGQQATNYTVTTSSSFQGVDASNQPEISQKIKDLEDRINSRG